MEIKKILTTDGKLNGIAFMDIESVNDIYKAQEVLNRLLLEVSVQCLTLKKEIL